PNGLEDRGNVVERLTHARERDVVMPGGRAGPPIGTQRQRRRAVPVKHLVDDLARAELPRKARLTRRAEWAANRAASLAGDADRGSSRLTCACRGAHEDRFDALSVMQLMHRLGSEAPVRVQDVGGDNRREMKTGIQGSPQADWKVGQVFETPRLGSVDAGQDLAGPIRGLAAGDEPRGA